MLMYDNNPGETVLAECMVQIGESIRLITKDNGRILDLTNSDHDIDSLRDYTLSNLLEVYTRHCAHYLTLSYNRNALEIR